MTENVAALPPSPFDEVGPSDTAKRDCNLNSNSYAAANGTLAPLALPPNGAGNSQHSTPPVTYQLADPIDTPSEDSSEATDIFDIDDIDVEDTGARDEGGHVNLERTNKAIDDLRADAVRCGGKLNRADVDRLYAKRNLAPVECALVERSLNEAGISVSDSDDDEQNEIQLDPSISEAAADIWKSARQQPFLDELEERACGRAIRLSRQAEEVVLAGANLDSTYLARVRADAHDAQRRLMESNLRWVARIANQYRRAGGMDPSDLLQEGAIGLLRATELYDPEMGFRFKTYATWWIRQAISRAISDKARTIRLPVHLHERLRKLRRAHQKLFLETGQEPTFEALGIAIGDTAERAAKLLWLADQSEVASIEAPITGTLTFDDVISVADSETSNYLDNDDRRRLLAAAMLDLTPREERVIRLRFGINITSDQTLQEIGDSFGVTRERIRQIEAKALRKLQHPSRKKKLAELLG